MKSNALDVSIRRVSRHYGSVQALNAVSLDIRAGEFVSLLGPSGSGKTTLLMILAGFDTPSTGSLSVGGRDFTRVPVNKRDIGMVFQKYALFPHMSVAANLAFPLRMRGLGKAERDTRVRAALDMVKLGGFAERMPAQLSGGQQQRVALARAIVFDPPVILMDEPLGALDKKLRQHMQIEIKQLQQRLRSTLVYVTHDQEEALHMSDRIAVLNEGELVQVGSSHDLYYNPVNAFVADFIGEMNFMDGMLTGGSADAATVRINGVEMPSRRSGVEARNPRVRLAIRPDRVRLTLSPDTNGHGLQGKIAEIVFTGSRSLLFVELEGGGTVKAEVEAANAQLMPATVGASVVLRWEAADALVFPV